MDAGSSRASGAEAEAEGGREEEQGAEEGGAEEQAAGAEGGAGGSRRVLHVRCWLLSCRSLHLGIEHMMINTD